MSYSNSTRYQYRQLAISRGKRSNQLDRLSNHLSNIACCLTILLVVFVLITL